MKPPHAPGGWTRTVTARPVLTLLLALLVTAFAVVAGSGVTDRMKSGGRDDPGSESTYASEALDRYFPEARPNLLLLVDSGRGNGVDDPAVAAEAGRLAARLATEPGIVGVTSYWADDRPALRSADGREALIAARVTGDDRRQGVTYDRIAPHYRGSHGPVEVGLGGAAAVDDELRAVIAEDLLRAETTALPVTLVLLIVVFGSAVAALLPLAVGIAAVLGTDAVLRGITEFTDVSVFAQNLTTALGLGLAVDYALFIVRRFREELASGRAPRRAVAVTLRTAGRTVLFSALTVAVSLSALLLFPQYFLRSFAYAGISVVLLAAAAALAVLPAALVLLGDRVNVWDLRRLFRCGRGAGAGRRSGGRGGRFVAARTVTRRAPLFAVATTVGLVLLGIPFLRVEFGYSDDRQLPRTSASRAVQQHLRDGFPGTPGGALLVYAEGGPSRSALAAYTRILSALPGVARVDGPVPGRDGRVCLSVVPEGEAAGPAVQRLVHDIRARRPPFKVSVGGMAAELADSKESVARVLPRAGPVVVLTTLILLFLLTGSVLIPFLAVLLNALGLTAMLGAIVWVFQEGHLAGTLGFTATGAVDTTLPVLMFCVAFGLSMDYGIFLLSRITEEHDRTGDHEDAIIQGLSRTGGLIMAAALVLAVVMVAIGTSRVTGIKVLGLGLALAVLTDALVVRALLVPAVLRLTGRATWWAPAPLRRLSVRCGPREDGPAPGG
ncbi:transporter [Streptomyces eurocidicus]|uniref:RND superfamily putative drug exporter n=1 Tax=Streptomyces eurocidicus TaxID=66423 RepID=A0A2N8P063_STREU|nr:MMPL family transporter [Streptomyces eurocidicus]MBB5118966.1 RND superfamily putative drug exporter [Streptomyces eurocidicus]MBF6051227.1 MMPL family transporter [Streptomyces eurocidicus]PNE34418.1 transporter [Streptomyces eurocidicus]